MLDAYMLQDRREQIRLANAQKLAEALSQYKKKNVFELEQLKEKYDNLSEEQQAEVRKHVSFKEIHDFVGSRKPSGIAGKIAQGRLLNSL